MPADPNIAPPSVETPAQPTTRASFDRLFGPGDGWFRALRYAEFRLFWTGNFVSNIGSWMQNVALGWLVYDMTHSPFWLGFVGFAQQIPALFFSLPGGVMADRTGRRKLLLLTQTTMMLLAIALAVLVSLGWVTVQHIVVIAFLAGTTMALNAPTYQAALTDLVPKEDMLNAIALNSIQFNTSRVFGPSIAGFAIAGVGVAACFYMNALSYVVLLVVLLKVKFPPPAERERRSMTAEFVEGFRYVWNHREIRVLVVLVALLSMFGLPYLVMMPSFARDVLNVGPAGLGYLVAAAGVGALLGGFHLASWKPHRRRGPLVLGAALVFCVAILLFCLSRHPLLSAALLGVAGAAMVSSVATVNSLIQAIVPNAIRGRVLSMHTMAFLGFTPLGSLLVGSLASRLGSPAALGLSSGFALVIVAVIALTATSVRRLQ